jgi:predicted ABC-type transport system involved in lysophospholipase L1 biosynthesis ATPase subunit
MVTHDEALAATADRVLELREGRLQERRAVPGQPP